MNKELTFDLVPLNYVEKYPWDSLQLPRFMCKCTLCPGLCGQMWYDDDPERAGGAAGQVNMQVAYLQRYYASSFDLPGGGQ